MGTRLVAKACLLALLAAPGAAHAGPTGEALFDARIRPLFERHCYRCHSAGAERLEGGLRLDIRDGWAKGGRSGPAIVPGDPGRSLLIRAVRQTDADLSMPPRGRLDAAAVADLERWVALGAPDPRGDVAGPVAAEAHWAFQPPGHPEPPRLEDDAWSRGPIDRFLLARLREAGLEPAPEADRRTLLRRASFDVLGLPPTPEEVETFLGDRAPDAWERQVDRLLASPHYGERWGRHWLDVARYSDSDSGLAMANAFEYRDWVVRALNADLPYDRFLAMQLAGDLLPDTHPDGTPRPERERLDDWIATAFLVLGPKDLTEVDKEKLLMDIVDEQIDALSRAFLGVSVACARCHDHKFDPVSTREYYALAGILRSTSVMAHLQGTSLWRERQIATREEIAAREAWSSAHDAARAELDAAVAEASAVVHDRWRARLADYLVAAQASLSVAVFREAEDFSRGNLVVDAEKWGSPDTVIVRSGSSGTLFVEYDLDLPEARALVLEARFAGVRSRPMRVYVNGQLVRPDGLAETTRAWDPGAQAWFEVLPLIELPAGRSVLRLEREENGTPHIDKLLLAPPGHFEGPGLVAGAVRNWASWLHHTAATNDPSFAPWHRLAAPGEPRLREDAAAVWADLVSEAGSGALSRTPIVAAVLQGDVPADLLDLAGRYQRALLSAAQGPEPDPRVWALLFGPTSAFALPVPEVEPYFDPAHRPLVASRRSAYEAVLREEPPPLRRTPAVEEGTIADVPVHIRGSHLDLADTLTPRGVPEAIAAGIPRPEIPEGASGRLELARWMTHPDHPLTSRVIVNRVWQGHFGRGLVRSPSDFGSRGDRPSHPELLDWLARRLVADGWSLKALHRRILLSSAYRMTTRFDERAARTDPENRLWWRRDRRPLEAEALRDALFAVSGTLDLEMGGSLLGIPVYEPVISPFKEIPVDYSSRRRSLYLPVVRSAPYDFFTIFDFADPWVSVGQRATSSVPQQALVFMNSPLVREASRELAAAVVTEARDDRERLVRLYQRALGRPPGPEELGRGLAGLLALSAAAETPPTVASLSASVARVRPVDPKAELRAWQGLAQVILSSNEFANVE